MWFLPFTRHPYNEKDPDSWQLVIRVHFIR